MKLSSNYISNGIIEPIDLKKYELALNSNQK